MFLCVVVSHGGVSDDEVRINLTSADGMLGSPMPGGAMVAIMLREL